MLLFGIILLLILLPIPALALPGNPVELGTVNWNRNFEESLDLAKAKQKPLLILFQEVPG